MFPGTYQIWLTYYFERHFEHSDYGNKLKAKSSPMSSWKTRLYTTKKAIGQAARRFGKMKRDGDQMNLDYSETKSKL